jgi:hypothetical protein
MCLQKLLGETLQPHGTLMHTRRLTRTLIAVGAVLLAAIGTNAGAQGISTGAIGGTVVDQNGNPVPAARVQVVNLSNGFSTGGATRDNGQFLVQGLEVGGPYRVSVRRIGFQPHTRDNVIVQLSQTSRLEV